MSEPKFVIITGPGASFSTVNALENRTLYNCPEAYKWDRHVAKYANEILDKDEPCAIITQSDIVLHQVLIRLKQKRLSVTDVAVYFCQTPDMVYDEDEPLIVKVELTERGRCKKAHPDFFAQYMDDLDELL